MPSLQRGKSGTKRSISDCQIETDPESKHEEIPKDKQQPKQKKQQKPQHNQSQKHKHKQKSQEVVIVPKVLLGLGNTGAGGTRHNTGMDFVR